MAIVVHPRRNDRGEPVAIGRPSVPTSLAAWADPAAIATVVPDGPMPHALGGVPVAPWHGAPGDDDAGWRALAEGGPAFDEPPPPVPPGGRKRSAGAVVAEPDGRVWVVHPTNRFGGYAATFPKGTADHGHDAAALRAVALREVHEEAGLRIELVGWLVDAVRTTSVARYYLARRVAGTPAAMGWESQAVSLVPIARLSGVCAHASDATVVEAVRKAIGT